MVYPVWLAREIWRFPHNGQIMANPVTNQIMGILRIVNEKSQQNLKNMLVYDQRGQKNETKDSFRADDVRHSGKLSPGIRDRY